MTALRIDVAGALPAGFPALRAEARREGFRFLDRLASEWEAGTARFDRSGEVLLAASMGDVLAGVGGLTLDPVVPDALRMRRFYVHPAFRRYGVGRRLAVALLERPGTAGRRVTVNAGTAGAPAFWEALGFVPGRCDGHTHVRRAQWAEAVEGPRRAGPSSAQGRAVDKRSADPAIAGRTAPI